MSAFYDRMAATTQRLIGQFGRTVTLRRVSRTYDPITGGEAETVEEQAVTCVILPASKGTVEAFDVKFERGTLIESNLRVVKLPAKGLQWPPAPGQEMLLDGETWRVIGVTPSSPGGVDLVYSLSVQR